MIEAVIFDMDGLLLDSEVYWEQARADYCRSQGCEWRPEDELTVKGHNSPEWATKIRDHCGFDTGLEEIINGVSSDMRRLYEQHLPVLPGALNAARTVAARYPVAIASSSPHDLIEFATNAAGIRDCFKLIVSADEAARGKPAPDVFLLTAERMGVAPENVAVFEDSSAGITGAAAAGMRVIAVPNPHGMPSPEALTRATRVLNSLLEFDVGLLAEVGSEVR